eukprot:CAMPEP_0204845582 /NCGR_PEP_ID=MMETSP1347-20130617/1288_1 /ASSEMBLY_ACC=CAM_ASM_000690 /TAXON_ID=215587 /ORGANISM="Aplanochytrium stocchinoi, Strain GSBS06" /LENGTH=284 /DNA_ID=CAMNT_0051985719 /DNA_START=190 /DNA_END=1044 /DNA_ORIENTATION=+
MKAPEPRGKIEIVNSLPIDSSSRKSKIAEIKIIRSATIFLLSILSLYFIYCSVFWSFLERNMEHYHSFYSLDDAWADESQPFELSEINPFDSSKPIHTFLIEPGLCPDLDCDLVEKYNSDISCRMISMSKFDSLSQKNRQIALEYAVEILKHTFGSIADADLIISGSRGANILTEAVRQEVVKIPSLMLSPFINGGDYFEEDNQKQVVEHFLKKNIPFFVATGDTADEEIVIYEPFLEFMQNMNLKEFIKQFQGDHNWYATSNMAPTISKIIETFLELSKLRCH